MAKAISSPCGWSAKEDNDDELVRKVQQHAKEVHNQSATREEVLAMAQPA